jgi:hypothetical protein
MSAINVLTLSNVAFLPRTCRECVRDHADTHVPVTRVPIVSARWSVETNDDGSRRLVERWAINHHAHDGG